MILVSACLLGHRVKYNGGDNLDSLLLKYSDKGRFFPICPEVLARLPVPRYPMELDHSTGKKVLAGKGIAKDTNGMDTTSYLVEGAKRALEMAEANHARIAILKESSPSCGVHTIYDGSFLGRKVRGEGVTAALFLENGIRVYSEKDLTAELIESLIAEDIKYDT